MKKKFIIAHELARSAAMDFLYKLPIGYIAIFTEPPRTPAQNDKLWPMLRDISDQVEWYGEKLTEDEWKDVLTAAIKRSRIVPGIDGGFVVVGGHTSRMSKAELTELLDLADAFGAEHNVKWTEDEQCK